MTIAPRRHEGIRLFVLHLALGGCLKAPPVRFGITADTGGHIAYVLDAAAAQAEDPAVSSVSVVTRLFEDAALGPAHALPTERLGPKVTIDRVATACRAYLEKDALAADRPAFTAAFLGHLAALPRRPDVIHAHFADAAAVAADARARFGIPFVYTPHALGLDKRAQEGGGPALDSRIAAERRAIAEADAILVSTRDEAERQVAAYGVAAAGRVHRLPPGVPRHRARDALAADAPGSASGSAPDGAPDGAARPIVLAIARPVRKKNLAALLRAYAATPALRARADLVILAGQHGGDRLSAEERAVVGELRALIDAHGLHGRVALPARHDDADVAALYRRAARGGVFVNPALHEPFGLTLLEAAAAGVPVVATRHGGPAEIVETIGHGLLVDPRDEAALGAACLRVVTEPALHRRLSDAARRNVRAYDWSRYAARSVALYAALRRPPRLLACDIDGTLTGCAAGAQAFARWHAARTIPFAVATGRSFEAARAVLRAWHLPPPDAFITDVGTRLLRPQPDGSWRECPAYAARLDAGWDRAAVAAALAPLSLAPQPPETAGPHKMSFFGTAAEAGAIRATLAAAGLAARVVFSHGRLIDVLAPHGGKAAAIAALAESRGLTLADCAAAGDSGNDLDMLEACGHAIVVGNASDELDGLAPRPGLRRVARHHAAGVMEGLAALGLADDACQGMAA